MSSKEIAHAQGFNNISKTELKTPTQTKTVKMSLDQYAICRFATTKHIESLKEKEVFFRDRLNASTSPGDVTNNQFFLKECRQQMRELKDLVKTMDKTELITEHKLY